MKIQLREPKLNAYKHALTGQTLIIEPQDKPAYDEHCKSYADLYKPVGRPEQILVQIIADDYWRALRGRALETALMSKVFERANVAGYPELDPKEEKTLSNLGLYLQRIERSLRNNTKALQEMQLARSASERNQQETQAKPNAEFVFSNPETSRRSTPPLAPPEPQSTPEKDPKVMKAA